jgi:hypothetical protein
MMDVQQPHELSMKRFNYASMIILTLPFVLLGVLVGIFETCAGTDGATTERVAGPFLWAYRRKV